MNIISLLRTLYRNTTYNVKTYLIIRELKEFYNISEGIVNQLELYMARCVKEEISDRAAKAQLAMIRLEMNSIKERIAKLCSKKKNDTTKI